MVKRLVDCEVRLFGSRLSPFVEKVARALHLKDVPFELVAVKSPSDFKRWNPSTGKMPVLEVDGERFFDSTFIVRKLDEWVPDPPLFAADTENAARQRFLEDWSDEALYWYVMGVRWTDANAAATAEQVAASLPVPGFLRALLKPVLRRQIRPQAVAQGLVRLPLDMLLGELDQRFGELEVFLGASPYFFSDRPSVADLAIFAQLCTLRSGPTPQAVAILDRHAALCALEQRVESVTMAPRLARAKQHAA